VLAWAVWALAMLGLGVAAWLDQLQRQAGSPEMAWLLQAASVPLLVAAVSATTVGALVGSRRPAHPVGWLLLGLGLLVVVNGVVSGYVNYGLLVRPGALPAAGYLAGVANGILVLAAAFQLARRRVQDVVDRRFNRRRDDAARVIAAFSARLREEVDLATLTAELLAVVEQTMQPTRASLWLRPPAQRSATDAQPP
jgi:hypothetical protein